MYAAVTSPYVYYNISVSTGTDYIQIILLEFSTLYGYFHKYSPCCICVKPTATYVKSY